MGAPLLLVAAMAGCGSPIPVPVEARPAPAKPVASSSSAPVAVEPPDADHDGVPDTRDVCPREPGADDANPAWAGCPYDAPPRPTPPPFGDLELLLGNTPRALDAKEIEMVSGLGAMMKDEATLTLLASAPTKAVAEGWLRIVEKQLVAGGVAKEKLVERSCVHPIRLVKTTVARGEKTCADLSPGPAAR